MKTTNRIRPPLDSSPALSGIEWARSTQPKTGTVNDIQVKKLALPSIACIELSLADLEEERLFVRNHRGEYCHTGVVDFQFTDLDIL